MKCLYISFPKANTKSAISKKNPTICAYSKNLSLGFFLKIISYVKNIACPPSNAGIGNKFKTPNIIDKKAVIVQKACQSQVVGNIFAIDTKLPKPLYAPVFGLTNFLSCLPNQPKRSTKSLVPAGNASNKL